MNDSQYNQLVTKSLDGDPESLRKWMGLTSATPDQKQSTFDKVKDTAYDNNSNALCMHGMLYRYGWGCKKDDVSAFNYFQKAINLGNAAAMNSAGLMYFNGLGVEKSHIHARKLFEKAVELEYPLAIGNLAYMCKEGLGGEKDYTTARELFKKAVELESSTGMYDLADMYKNGLGGEKNEVAARELYQKSANLGLIDSMYQLALMYQYGKGGRKDEIIAQKWYQQVISVGKEESQIVKDASFKLAKCYEETYKNDEIAIELYKQSGHEPDAARLILKPLSKKFNGFVIALAPKNVKPTTERQFLLSPHRLSIIEDVYEDAPLPKPIVHHEKHRITLSRLREKLRSAADLFFERPITQETYERFYTECETLLDNAEEQFQHIPRWHDTLKPILKGILGIILAIPAVLAGIVTLVFSGKNTLEIGIDRYITTFFRSDIKEKKAISESIGLVKQSLFGTNNTDDNQKGLLKEIKEKIPNKPKNS